MRLRFLSIVPVARTAIPAVLTVAFLSACTGHHAPHPEADRTVSGLMQARPGGPLEETEVDVYKVPVDPPAHLAGEAGLDDNGLVIGVVADGEAMAYPIRYIALHEVIDDAVGETPIAATW